MLIGSHAVGLAGAFTGVADDASATFYNPAGIAFTGSSLTLSTNAYYHGRTASKGFSFADDISTNSSGNIASFFGATRSLTEEKEALKVGFAIFVPYSNAYEQRSNTTGEIFGNINTSSAQVVRSETSVYSFAVAKQLNSNFALGTGFALWDYMYSSQVFSYSTIGPIKDDEHDRDFYLTSLTNLDENMTVRALEISPSIFWQLSDRWSLGLMISFSDILKQNYENLKDSIMADTDKDGKLSNHQDHSTYKAASNERLVKDLRYLNWPDRHRLGVSYKANSFLYAIDVSHYGKVDTNEAQADLADVVNYHLGVEWERETGRSLSFGYFSNNDSYKRGIFSSYGQLSYKKENQNGIALSIADIFYDTQFRISMTYQNGKNVKIDPFTAQEVDEIKERYTAYLSITNKG